MALSVVYFRFTHRMGRPHYVCDEYLYGVLEEVEVMVTVCGSACVVSDDERKGECETAPPHSLFFSENTKGAARLNVPFRWTNRFQHTYCGMVWKLIQACDVQSSD